MTLTPCERAVLAGIVAGKQSKEIARDLGQAFGTVKTHTRALFAKTGARSRTELAVLAVRGELDDAA